MIQRRRLHPSVSLAALLSLFACERPKFTEPLILADGTEIPASVLERGRTAYTLYCRACHGEHGDGQGPAALGLRPPPRDFRLGKFKFAAVTAGDLPNDDDLRRIIRGGLAGTAMLPWELPDDDMNAVIQYIKTFKRVDADQSRWEKDLPGKPIIPSLDPWQARTQEERDAVQAMRADPSYQPKSEAARQAIARETEALTRGEKVYHVVAQCTSCHPAYATRATINGFNRELRGSCLSPAGFRGFADNDLNAMYLPAPKDSDYRYPADQHDVVRLVKYLTPILEQAIDALDNPADKAARYDALDKVLDKIAPKIKQAIDFAASLPPEQEFIPNSLRAPEQVYVSQRLADAIEAKNVLYLVPPDFLFHTVRSGSTYPDLYRTIASGIGGTPMPAWYGILADDDLWALVHYVSYLIDLKQRPKAVAALRATLAAQPVYTTPSDCNAKAPESAPTTAPASQP